MNGKPTIFSLIIISCVIQNIVQNLRLELPPDSLAERVAGVDTAATQAMNPPPRVLLSSSAPLRSVTASSTTTVAAAAASSSHSTMIMMNTDENALSDFNFELY